MKPRIRYNRTLKVWTCRSTWGIYFTLGFGITAMDAYASWLVKRESVKEILKESPFIITTEAPIALDHELPWWKRFSFSN